MRWPRPPPPPTQYYLGYANACSLPLKAPPYLRTDKISEPPFRGLFAGFSCLGDPLKSKTLLNVPLIFYFITPFFNFAGVQRERERKTTPFLKEISGWKVKYPPFLQFSGRTLSHEKYPLYRRFWEHACGPSDPGVGGGGGAREVTHEFLYNYKGKYWTAVIQLSLVWTSLEWMIGVQCTLNSSVDIVLA